MAIARTTIMASEALMNRVLSHTKAREETITDFYNRAIVNQLEKDGDFEVRDIMEREIKNGEKSY